MQEGIDERERLSLSKLNKNIDPSRAYSNKLIKPLYLLAPVDCGDCASKPVVTATGAERYRQTVYVAAIALQASLACWPDSHVLVSMHMIEKSKSSIWKVQSGFGASLSRGSVSPQVPLTSLIMLQSAAFQRMFLSPVC